MSNYISDFTKTHWMVSNPVRIARTGMDGKPFRCPFCPGNEADTPPEIYRVGDGEANKTGWKVRVVPNKFNITEIHEVIIHSQDHNKNVEELSLPQIEDIIKTYINRFNFLKDKGKVFIFSNQSLISGASLVHSHSQISVVLNDIPTETLPVQPIVNIVEQSGEFVSYCPEYSEWAYEVWIRTYNSKLVTCNFENLSENQIKDLAKILQSTILKLKKIHDENSHYSKKPFGYNFYISIPQSCPESFDFAQDKLVKGWYLRIIPRFMERAGFELSTGIMVNSVEAKRASEELRNMKQGT
ncbi:MAG: hypothetical protein AAB437_03295 [Patescibacteria group bacterium]